MKVRILTLCPTIILRKLSGKRLVEANTLDRTTSNEPKVDKTGDSDTQDIHDSSVHLVPHVVKRDDLEGSHVHKHGPDEVNHLVLVGFLDFYLLLSPFFLLSSSLVGWKSLKTRLQFLLHSTNRMKWK